MAAPLYNVYAELTGEDFLIVPVGEAVIATYTFVFGPGTMEECESYVLEHC